MRWSGFTLDVQSIQCADRENYLQHSDYHTNSLECNEKKVRLSAGEVQHDALVTEIGYYKYYKKPCFRYIYI